MRVRLGYAWQGNPVGAVVDVDDVTGRQLLREGKGQRVEDPSLLDALEVDEGQVPADPQLPPAGEDPPANPEGATP